MVEFFLQFHSGWRFLVILTTVLVAIFFLVALITNRTKERHEIVILKIWTGIVDTQFLLGIILVGVMLLDGKELYRQLIEHITVGVFVVLVAHAPAIYKRLNGEPSTQTRRIMGLVLPVLMIIMVAIGISALGRGIFEMTRT